MVAKKKRIRVLLDTNVFVRALKAKKKTRPNHAILRLWLLEKRVQLVVSEEVIAEYLEIFEEVLGFDRELIEEWRVRLQEDSRSSLVRLGRRFKGSRDPDDNLMLSTASAGDAGFLVTNDKDLLDLSADLKKALPFVICRPAEFLQALSLGPAQ